MAATLHSPISIPMPPRARVAVRRPVRVAAPVAAPAPAQPGWLERLALWADAQPPHRRLGSWTLLR